MANRRHWAAGAGVGVAAAALLMTGLTTTALGSAFDGPDSAAGSPGATAGAGGASASAATGADAEASSGASAVSGGRLTVPYFGAFTDSGAEGVRNLAGLSQWLGGTPVRVGHTYLPGGTWQDIEGDDDLLRPWADWRRADPGRLFVLNVPMQARNEQHLGDSEVRDLIRQGADGYFDQHFTRLAEHLVGLGVPDTVIVLGWEMNGITYTHRCAPDPAGWKAYWNRVVAAMRAVPGQRFRFDFAPSRGRDAIGWTECYPGDAAVDIIGMDSYDQPSGESFDEQVGEPYGLQAQVDFAARHGKAISYPEWGLFRNGDDPDYMGRMLRWMTEHGALYQTVTDYCPHGVWQCDENPRASRVFRTLLYAEAPRPTPSTPASASPSPSQSVSPSPSASPSVSPSDSASASPLPTVTATAAPTLTPTATATPVPTPTVTHTPAPTPTVTATAAPAPEPSSSPAPTPSATPSTTPSATPSPTATSTATPSTTPTATQATGVTPTPSGTPTATPSASGTESASAR